jgi:hypothetical protein
VNGLSFVAVAFAPMLFAVPAASSALVNGPTVSVNRCAEVVEDLIDVPRSMDALRLASAGMTDTSSRTPAQPRSTPERTRDSAAASRPSEYASASRERSVRPSARATRRSRAGPTVSTVAATTFVVLAVMIAACARATDAKRSALTTRTFSPFSPPTRA